MASKWEYIGQISTSVTVSDGSAISLAALIDDAQIDGILEKYPDLRVYYRPKNPNNNNNGSGDLNYLHIQGTPEAIWTIPHNMGKFPSIVVIDSAGTEQEGDPRHITENLAEVHFSAPFSGRASCN